MNICYQYMQLRGRLECDAQPRTPGGELIMAMVAMSRVRQAKTEALWSARPTRGVGQAVAVARLLVLAALLPSFLASSASFSVRFLCRAELPFLLLSCS
jgi:hypothetical protein